MTWYVDPKTGSDSNDGKSADSAFKTLLHALQAASAGDTVLLVPGPYDENLPQLVSTARVAHTNVGVVGSH